MRNKGMLNWVLHNGKAIDLEDPEDTASMSESLLVKLIQRATDDNGTTVLQDNRQVAIPLQHWEVEKLQSIAAQTISAVQSGRYNKDYGEALLKQLQGWSGADAWVKEEAVHLQTLVEAHDAARSTEMVCQLEHHLIETLREIHKDLNRGVLCGFAETSSCSHASVRPTAAPVVNSDAEEQRALQVAIIASLAEPAPAVVLSSSPSTTAPIAGACGHCCDVASMCCRCVLRKPRPGMLCGFLHWWRLRGLQPPIGDSRFLCGSFSAVGFEGYVSVPLPFGGTLIRADDGDEDRQEFVQLAGIDDCHSEASWSEAALSSEDGSWVLVSDWVDVEVDISLSNVARDDA